MSLLKKEASAHVKLLTGFCYAARVVIFVGQHYPAPFALTFRPLGFPAKQVGNPEFVATGSEKSPGMAKLLFSGLPYIGSWMYWLAVYHNCSDMRINLILFGPPGSGKGTQAAKLVEKYGLLHISTGDLFRYEMGNDTPLGQEAKSYIAKGELVPDSVTIGMLRNKVEANLDVPGYIFDGFPRTIPQCEALDALLADMDESISRLIMLDVPDTEIIERILNRGMTSGRSDDMDQSIIQNRIDVYKSETTPVFDYYAAKGKSVKVVGVGSIEDIFARLSSEIDVL